MINSDLRRYCEELVMKSENRISISDLLALIRMARKETVIKLDGAFYPFNMEQKVKADLIAAELEAVKMEEREACANIAGYHHGGGKHLPSCLCALNIANEIRSRGEA